MRGVAAILLLLADSSGSGAAPVDLLALVDLTRDRVHGGWEREGRALTCTEPARAARVILPYVPPAEYDLLLRVERREGADALVVGLASGDAQFVHVIDGYTAEGKCLSGFEVLDGALARDNESRRDGRVLSPGVVCDVVYRVRTGSVSVLAGGREVLSWTGGISRLKVREDYRIAYPGALFVGAWESRFRITQALLMARSRGGVRLRDR
jgi:hypothetical protein